MALVEGVDMAALDVFDILWTMSEEIMVSASQLQIFKIILTQSKRFGE